MLAGFLLIYKTRYHTDNGNAGDVPEDLELGVAFLQNRLNEPNPDNGNQEEFHLCRNRTQDFECVCEHEYNIRIEQEVKQKGLPLARKVWM